MKRVKATIVHMVAMAAFVMLFVLLSAVAQGSGQPGIDPLQRPESLAGRLDYSLSISHLPAGTHEVLHTSAGPITVSEHTSTNAVEVGLAYHLTETTAVNTSIRWTDVHRYESVTQVTSQVERTTRTGRVTSSVALRQRLAPESPLDPQLAVAVEDGGPVLELTLFRILDPMVTAATVLLSQRRSQTGVERKALVGGSVGFVANDRIHLVVGFDHRFSVGQRSLPITFTYVRWGWVIDPVWEKDFGIRVGSQVQGRERAIYLGVEWGGRWRRS